MNFYFLVASSFKKSSTFNLFLRVFLSSVLILQSCYLSVVSFFNYLSSSIKYNFIAIIFPHSFHSIDSNLAFREEIPIVKTQDVVFIPAIGVAGNDLFIYEIGFINNILSLAPLTLFSGIGDITDCGG